MPKKIFQDLKKKQRKKQSKSQRDARFFSIKTLQVMKLIEYQSFHDSFNKFRCKSFALFIAPLSMAFETL